METQRCVETDRAEGGAHDTVRTTETWREPFRRIRKKLFLLPGYGKALRWAGGAGCRNPMGGEEHQHRPCKRSSSSSSVRLPVKHSGHIADKKLQTMPQHGEGVLSAASQVDGMAFYRWKVRVSWRCIYRYLRWIGSVYCLLQDRTDACWDVGFFPV